MKPLENKVALITGGGRARGIGFASALRLAELGAHIALCGSRASDERDGCAASIRESGARCEVFCFDVEDEQAVRAAIADVDRAFGSIDVAVCNAGWPALAPFEDAELTTFDKCYRVNVRGVVTVCQAVIPIMRRRGGGSIIVNASVAGLYGYARQSAYVASKWAAVGLVKAMALELGEYGIRVNAVCPGLIDTDMGDQFVADFSATRGITVERGLATLAREPAVRRLGTPGEVAELIAFLADPASSFITGAAIPVTGGAPRVL